MFWVRAGGATLKISTPSFPRAPLEPAQAEPLSSAFPKTHALPSSLLILTTCEKCGLRTCWVYPRITDAVARVRRPLDATQNRKPIASCSRERYDQLLEASGGWETGDMSTIRFVSHTRTANGKGQMAERKGLATGVMGADMLVLQHASFPC